MTRRSWVLVSLVAIPGAVGGLVAYGLLRFVETMEARMVAER